VAEEEEYVRIRQADIDALCPELRAVVDDAVAAGNEVVETWHNFGKAVMLNEPRPVLLTIPPDIRNVLTYRALNDPHYWLGEIYCSLHPEWFVALPFTAGSIDLPSLGLRRFR